MAMIHMEPQTLQLFERVLGTLKPPPNLTLSQWADKYRRLSAEASSQKASGTPTTPPFRGKSWTQSAMSISARWWR